MDSLTLIDRDLASGIIDINQATLFKTYALFKSPRLPSHYQSNILIQAEAGVVLLETLAQWEQLDAPTQQTLSDFLTPKEITTTASLSRSTLARPVPGRAAPAAQVPGRHIVDCSLTGLRQTPHFWIWYPVGLLNLCRGRVDNAYIDTIATGLENAWSKYSTLGYRVPSLTLVFVVPVAHTTMPGMSLPGAILLSNDIDLSQPRNGNPGSLYLQALSAHEFFHSAQWLYFASPPACRWVGGSLGQRLFAFPESWVLREDVRWWMEATAQWAQHEVYSNDNSYFGLLRAYLDRPWQHIDTRPVRSDPFSYGTVLFPIYLTERPMGSGALIRSTWERYSQMNSGCGPMMPPLQSALQAQGMSIEGEFPGFSQANYLWGYLAQGDFRDPSRDGVGQSYQPGFENNPMSEQTLNADGPRRSDGGETVQRLASTYVRFENQFSNSIGRSLAITVSLSVESPSVDPVVKVWAIKEYSGTVDYVPITPSFRLANQTGNVKTFAASAGVLNFDSYRWVTMAIVNPQTSGASLTYSYSARVIPPAVLYTGGSNKGFVSTTGGASWNVFAFPNPVQAVAAVSNTQGLVGYMGTSDLKLWKTVDGGQTFSIVHDLAAKVQPIVTNASFSLIAMDPGNDLTVYAGFRGNAGYGKPDRGALFRSTDGGHSFGSDLLAHCHANQKGWQDCAITALAIDPRNSNTLWIGQNGWNATTQAVMRSTDWGNTWQTALNMQSTFTPLSLSQSDPNVVWAMTLQGLDGEWMRRTPNGGITWNQASLDSTINPAERMVLADPFDPLTAWASGGGGGLKVSRDGNATWTRISYGFYDVESLGSPVLYGTVRWSPGFASVERSTDGGLTWAYIGHPEMTNAGPLSVVAR